MKYAQEKAVALEAAHKACQEMTDDHHADLRDVDETEAKEHLNDLVTENDKAAQKASCETIRESFPDDAIIAEETQSVAQRESEREWIVDPIDGTMNYTTGLPVYCVSIAFRVAGEIKIGVVRSPKTALDRTWIGVRGSGAYVRTTDGEREISVSGKSSLNGATIGAYDCDSGRLWEHDVNIRRWGSAAIEMCLVAGGHYDAYINQLDLGDWDTAAGKVIVEEAGGRVSNRRVEDEDVVPLVASNGEIHDYLEVPMETLNPSR